MLVAPSVLSADFGHLASEVEAICAAGADYVHVDVMDGGFVPNMTIGPLVVDAIKKASSKPLDIHLMVEDNSFFIDLFAHTAPEYLTVHYESERHLHRAVQKIRNLGIKPGVSLNPHTDVSLLEPIIEELELVLVMSVNPGFGGQKFIDYSLKKVERLRAMVDGCGTGAIIEVDGGVNDKTVGALKNAGADMVVAGSYVFGSGDYQSAIESLRV